MNYAGGAMKKDPEPIQPGEIEHWLKKDAIRAVPDGDAITVTIDLDLFQMEQNLSDDEILFLKNLLGG